MKLQIDLSRIENEIKKQEERLAQMNSFLSRANGRLLAAENAIDEVLIKKRGCTLISIDNIYSTGGTTHEEYTEKAYIRATCHAVLTQQINNIDLFKKRLSANWDYSIGAPYGVNIAIGGISIKGNKLAIDLVIGY